MDTQQYVQLMLIAFIVSVVFLNGCTAMTRGEKKELRNKVLEMFHHAYNNYMDKAYPLDELMPLSCKGRGRGTEPSRGDIDDTLGNFSLTLIDTLDTLAVLGEVDEFSHAVNLVISDVSFDTDVVVSVFETNIRVLGGLLGGHTMAIALKRKHISMSWYDDELLELAKDLGQRLLPAFNTSTGIPYPRVNLKYGIKHHRSRTGSEKDTCTSCAGTMILEFSALSRMTGMPEFEKAAEKAMTALWKSRHRGSDLVGTVINIHNGDWVRRDSGVGAGIDSYYEYLLKAYILLGEESYLDRFNKHYRAVMKYISNGPMMVDVHMHRPLTNSRNFMDALLAFWPGLQVLKGDIKPAIETHEMLYQITQRHNFLPEAFTTDFRVHWGQHPLRPEFIESTYFIYKATGDSHYLDVGRSVLENLEKHAKVPCGFAAIKDVTTMEHEDQMDSFVLAETFKYLYLLFAEKENTIIDIDNYLFTTEAHLLPLTLSKNDSRFNITKDTGTFVYHDEDDDYERSCPNTNHMFKGNKNFAQNLRIPLKNFVDKVCPRARTGSRRSRLKASEFMAGNKEQLDQLSRMGIRIVTMPDGRVQLLHTASEAATNEDAEDGMLFMQEMIELSKTQAQDVQQEPRLVQLISPPHLGSNHLNAGPAQFGVDLKTAGALLGQVVVAQPYRACKSLVNLGGVKDKIVIMERGDCMFIDKARVLQSEGAIGGIVIDNAAGTSSKSMPLFAMSGDGKTDVHIPMLFLFHQEGTRLLEALSKDSELWIRMGHTAVNQLEATKLLKNANVNVDLIEITSKTISSELPQTQVEDGNTKRRSVIEDIEETRNMLQDLMKKLNVGSDVNVRVRTASSGSEANPNGKSVKGPDNIQQAQIPVDQVLGQNDESKKVFKDMMSLLQKKQGNKQQHYLDIVKKLIHTVIQSGTGVFGGNMQENLDRINDEIREKYGGRAEDEEAQNGDNDSEGDQAPLDSLTKNLNAALNIYVDEQLNSVLEEAKRGLEESQVPDISVEHKENTDDATDAAECLSQQAGPAEDEYVEVGKDNLVLNQKEELKSFATEEELIDAEQPNKEQRYVSPSVQKAPEWMDLKDGQIFIDQDGNIFMKDGPDDIDSHIDPEEEALRYHEGPIEDISDSKIDYEKIKSDFVAQQDLSSKSAQETSSAGTEEDIEADAFELPKIRLDIKSLTPKDYSQDSVDTSSEESGKDLPSDSDAQSKSSLGHPVEEAIVQGTDSRDQESFMSSSIYDSSIDSLPLDEGDSSLSNSDKDEL